MGILVHYRHRIATTEDNKEVILMSVGRRVGRRKDMKGMCDKLTVKVSE